jgi:diacylglycerol kinase family enzyme
VRVLVLYNPNAGRGRGQRVAESVSAMLERRGLTADLLATVKEPPETFRQRLTQALTGTDLLIVAGGDGTLHSTLPSLVGSAVPVYHLAMGTENLFARQFGMDRHPQTLERALDRSKVLEVDLGVVSIAGTEVPFVLMCSLGPDASVIRRLDEARNGPISHLSYVRPILAELLDPCLPRVTIEVDGRRVVDAQSGMVVIANSRQYALRIDPAYKASMTDGLLDAVFFPCKGRLCALAAVIRSRLRSHGKSTVYNVGRSVTVLAEDHRPVAVEVDGECQRPPEGRLDLRADIRPKALKVLSP